METMKIDPALTRLKGSQESRGNASLSQKRGGAKQREVQGSSAKIGERKLNIHMLINIVYFTW